MEETGSEETGTASNMEWTGPGGTRTHRTQAEAAAAASTELVPTLGTGEVETAPPGQAEDALAAGTLWGQQRYRSMKENYRSRASSFLPSGTSGTCWRFLPMLW